MASVAETALLTNPDAHENDALISAKADQSFPDAIPQGLPLPRESAVGIREEPPIDDADWAGLPRGSVKLAEAFRDWGAFSARSLFRSIDLNPDDVYIPRDSRLGFEAWFEEARRRVGELSDARAKVERQEFRHLHSLGLLQSLSFDDYVKNLDERERGEVELARSEFRKRLAEMGRSEKSIESSLARWHRFPASAAPADAYINGVRGGKMVWAKLAEMPQSQHAAGLYYSAASVMMSEIALYFKPLARGNEAQQLIDVEAFLSRYRVL